MPIILVKPYVELTLYYAYWPIGHYPFLSFTVDTVPTTLLNCR
jgi:hypothetical protein